MKLRISGFLTLFFALGLVPGISRAQGGAENKLVFVTPKNLTALNSLPGGTRAVSLGVSRSALEKDDVARSALMAWVKAGGNVFLHTDAAQLFGYRTVAPRRATNRVAGQFWGRAKAAIPFGAHPLLQGTVLVGASRNGVVLGPAVTSVRTVYYQLEQGDSLVFQHTAAVPLLRVTDLAMRSQQALYAAAIAPYGRGWAIFTPSFIEPNRADGALFLRNLMAWAGAPLENKNDRADEQDTAPVTSSPAPAVSVSVPASVIERAAKAATDDDFDSAATALAFLKATNRAPVTAGADTDENTTEVLSQAGVPLAQGELLATIDLLSADKTAAPRAAVLLLRARLAWQRGDGRDAAVWLARAAALAPDAAEVFLWNGIIAAQASEDRSLASPVRARYLAEASVAWQRSLQAVPLVRVTSEKVRPDAEAVDDEADEAHPAGGDILIGGIPRALMAAWIRAASVAAKLFAVEPPLVTVVGTGENSIVIRHFANDPSLRLAVPTAQLLVAASAALGARADDEEALFFPTAEYYAAYRRAAGLTVQNAPAPGGFYGDAVGGRMLLLSQLTQFVMLPPNGPGKPPRPMLLSTALAPVMGRLHAQVLIQQLAGGQIAGALPVPAWMEMGLAAYAGLGTEVGVNGPETVVPPIPNGVLTPASYRAIAAGATPDALADFQALRLMTYFYARFGAGAVVETLQRLGSGENLDSALNATTSVSESEFFAAWFKAETGTR